MFNIICMDELKDMALNNKKKMLNKFKKVSNNNYGVEKFVVKEMKPITMDKLNIESYFYKAKNFDNNDYKLSFENTMQYQFTDMMFNHLKKESFEQLDTQYLLDSMEPIEIKIQHNTISFEERVNKARNSVLKELSNE